MPVGQHKSNNVYKNSTIVTDINNYYIPATLGSMAPVMNTTQYRVPAVSNKSSSTFAAAAR